MVGRSGYSKWGREGDGSTEEPPVVLGYLVTFLSGIVPVELRGCYQLTRLRYSSTHLGMDDRGKSKGLDRNTEFCVLNSSWIDSHLTWRQKRLEH